MRDDVAFSVSEVKSSSVDVVGFPLGAAFQASPFPFFNLLSVIFDHLSVYSGFHWFTFLASEIKKRTPREQQRLGCPPLQSRVDNIDVDTGLRWHMKTRVAMR